MRRAFAHPSHNMLDHDDRVVDDQPHRGRHAAESHHVEAHVKNIEQQHRGREHAGHGNGRDQRDLQIAQEEQKDEHRENNADDHRIAHAAR